MLPLQVSWTARWSSAAPGAGVAPHALSALLTDIEYKCCGVNYRFNTKGLDVPLNYSHVEWDTPNLAAPGGLRVRTGDGALRRAAVSGVGATPRASRNGPCPPPTEIYTSEMFTAFLSHSRFPLRQDIFAQLKFPTTVNEWGSSAWSASFSPTAAAADRAGHEAQCRATPAPGQSTPAHQPQHGEGASEMS
ncbi:hypothetical protein O3P69_001409 [Scylla paramamosain]|uniref:Uncharacterized protein n=1 Tax=Scylla paramamosain TaxID=85552 RepID=A0AAW0UXB4_SCYPA